MLTEPPQVAQAAGPSLVSEHTLRELSSAGAAIEAVIAGLPDGGFSIRISYGSPGHPIVKTLGTSRRAIRRYGSLDTAASLLCGLSIEKFAVDMRHHRPGLVRPPRPDRAEALKKTRTTPRQASLLDTEPPQSGTHA